MLWTKENHAVRMADVVFVNNLKFDAGNLNFRFVSDQIEFYNLCDQTFMFAALRNPANS